MNKIKFYPFNQSTTEFTPKPYPALKAIPDWYRNQPSVINEKESLAQGFSTSTIKRCMPIFDYITAGYILSIPCDIYIDATNPEKLEWSVPQPMKTFAVSMISSHAPEQYSHFPIDTDKYHKQLFRILPFWSVKTDPGYSCMFLHPTHKDPLPFLTIEAIIDTDNFITDGHVSMLIEKNFKGVLKQGTPFIQVFPFQREDWQMELVEPDVAQKEINAQRLSLRSTFSFGYKNKMRSKKDFK